LEPIWDRIAADGDRRRRALQQAESRRINVLRDCEARAQRAAGISDRAERTERVAAVRTEQEAEAARLDQALQTKVAGLTGLLRAAAHEPARDMAAFRRYVPTENPPTLDDVSMPPRPQWSQFAPAQPGLFGRRRYERDIVIARAEFEAALASLDRRQQEAFEQLSRAHRTRVTSRRRAHDATWDAIAEAVSAADPDAVSQFAGTILQRSPALRGLLDGGRATYEAPERELVLEIDLPDTEVVPSERSWKYFVTRKTVEPVKRPAGDAADLYAALIAQLVLAMLDACFRGIAPDTVDAVSINGHVRTTDPATGQPDHPCLITVSADRSTYVALDLQHPKLDPKACLRKLGAEMSPNPHGLEHIRPIVDFEMAKYRIAHGPEALAQLDHRMDLLTMNPYEFERIVRDLFAKMGYDTWRTESSRDDGIDAVATKSDPHMPVECIVQAKRFKGAVSPKEIQALMGAMAEKPTATHGYLVTTSWLSPRSRQRARGQRIHTIERNQLASMIKDLLGYDVLISNSPPIR
jgi:restriction system protein